MTPTMTAVAGAKNRLASTRTIGLLVLVGWLLMPCTAEAITNGSADLSWDNPGANEPIMVQYQSFADATWKPFTLSPSALNTAENRYHAAGTFTAFPPDTLTDHWLCIRAQFVNQTDKTVWGSGNCTQVPVSPPVVQPPSNLKITQLDINTVLIEASSHQCRGIRTSGSGLTRTVRCLPKS